MGCYNDDFLFLHIPKTGGTSVKRALWEQLPGMRGQMPAGPGESQRKPTPDNPFPIGHIPLRDVERLLERPASSWKAVVAVIRNPYVQQVSQWLFWQGRYQRGGRHPHDVAAACYPTIHGWLEDPRCDFHRWYAEAIHPHQMEANPTNDYRGFPGTYQWWVTDSQGRVAENLVLLRQEQLEADLGAFIQKLYGWPLQLPRVNVGDWDATKALDYIVHPDRPRESLRALDLVEAKFRWAFSLHYQRVDRRQMLSHWLQAGILPPDLVP